MAIAQRASDGAHGGAPPAPADRLVCGIVVPQSSIDGCSEAHWAQVRHIVRTAAESAGFEANLVSTADHGGAIQKRIIQDLYENTVVVCDVSGKNPHVLFELGLRLAFDKPTIIIKDDKTNYVFEIEKVPIELEYPRNMSSSKISDFKIKLADSIKATYVAADTNPHFTPFLSHLEDEMVSPKETPGR